MLFTFLLFYSNSGAENSYKLGVAHKRIRSLLREGFGKLKGNIGISIRYKRELETVTPYFDHCHQRPKLELRMTMFGRCVHASVTMITHRERAKNARRRRRGSPRSGYTMVSRQLRVINVHEGDRLWALIL